MTKLKLRLNKKGLSTFAERTLLKLHSIGAGTIMPDSRLQVGSMHAPPSVVDALLVLDLVRKRENKVTINSVGEAYIRRMKHPSHIKVEGDLSQSSAYAGQHRLQGEKSVKEGIRTKIYKTNIGETPLGWLLQRKGKDGKSMISREQFLAGERLREDFERSGIAPNVTLNYGAIIRSQGGHHVQCGMNVADHTIAAKKRLDNALEDVGPGLKDVLFRVCCHLEGLEVAEKNLGWPIRSGKVVLAIALSRLSCHYNNQIG